MTADVVGLSVVFVVDMGVGITKVVGMVVIPIWRGVETTGMGEVVGIGTIPEVVVG
jgi:hypothetical protein